MNICVKLGIQKSFPLLNWKNSGHIEPRNPVLMLLYFRAVFTTIFWATNVCAWRVHIFTYNSGPGGSYESL